jgi:hypothetical protein
MDSGATNHCVASHELLSSYQVFDTARKVYVGNGQHVLAYGSGNIAISIPHSSELVVLNDIWYTPSMVTNLLSVHALAEQGFNTLFTVDSAQVVDTFTQKPVFTAFVREKSYCISLRTSPDSSNLYYSPDSTVSALPASRAFLSPNYDSTLLWHRRLGHVAGSSMQKVMKAVDGMPDIDSTSCLPNPCSSCLAGKHTASSHPSSERTFERPMQLVYADITGPFMTALNGEKYSLNMIDAHSSFSIALPMKLKSDTLSLLKLGIARLETLSGHKLTELRTDNDAVFTDRLVRDFLSDKLVHHSYSAPYIHQQVGRVERLHRSLQEITRSLLHDSAQPPVLWAEAMRAASYLRNLRPSKVDQTPYELFTGTRPDVSHLRVWGSKCFVHVPAELQTSKLNPRTQEGVLVGFTDNPSAYRVVFDRKVFIRSDVVFDEAPMSAKHAVITPDTVLQPFDMHDVSALLPGADHVPFAPEHVPAAPLELPADEVQEPTGPVGETHEHAHHDRPRREIRQPGPWWQVQQGQVAFTQGDAALPVMVNGVMPEVPETIEDAFAGPHAYHWRKAVQAELDSMSELNVFELADAPLDRKPLTAKWVFTWKANAEGQIVKAKARLVARGFQQKEGQDYSELFAPTVSQVTFKVLMAHAASHNLLVHQLDVKTAFLYGDLDKVLYMQQPPGCSDGSGRVWRLLKSLYGLKQAPRQWHHKLKSVLENLGYVQSLHDPALFYRLESDSYRSYLIMHVDDLLIAHGDINVINAIKSELSTVFTITDLGVVSKYLGIEVA